MHLCAAIQHEIALGAPADHSRAITVNQLATPTGVRFPHLPQDREAGTAVGDNGGAGFLHRIDAVQVNPPVSYPLLRANSLFVW